MKKIVIATTFAAVALAAYPAAACDWNRQASARSCCRLRRPLHNSWTGLTRRCGPAHERCFKARPRVGAGRFDH